MNKAFPLVLAPFLCLAAACSRPPVPVPVPGGVPAPVTEQVTGQALGAGAARGTVTFPALVFSGPVTTVARDARLDLSGAAVLATPRGNLDVRYATAARASLPAEAGHGARTCLYRRTAASGSYTVTGGTGMFSGAAGHGTWSLVIVTEVRASGGTCSPSGVPVPAGDQADFTASGPLQVSS
ncbi:MAG: hypothetical protein JWM19_982 [Actinomycetia bacterium]|nr:hypothetical protein [Actinomycetes bacterium]